jgi:tRNA G26 N,N-dimethylase Trm1
MSNFITRAFRSIFYVDSFYIERGCMRVSKDRHESDLMKIEERVLDVYTKIQEQIMMVCQRQNSCEVVTFGFEETSSLLFEGSWQEKVVKLLEKDGFNCTMTFNYKDGVKQNTLKISWE